MCVCRPVLGSFSGSASAAIGRRVELWAERRPKLGGEAAFGPLPHRFVRQLCARRGPVGRNCEKCAATVLTVLTVRVISAHSSAGVGRRLFEPSWFELLRPKPCRDSTDTDPFV
jgi:hypothetical protein